MLNVTEIIKAWSISLNPTEEQLLLAEKRYSVCKECEFFKHLPKFDLCSKCLCPINKKIFTQDKKLICPIGKWNDIK